MRSRPAFAVVVAACLATFATTNIVGELPAKLQTTLVYATGIHADARQPDAARALSNYLQLESAVAAIRKNGMVPAPR